MLFSDIKYHSDATKNSKKCIENLVDIKSLQKDDGITCMAWGNPQQTEILVAKKNQEVSFFYLSKRRLCPVGTRNKNYRKGFYSGRK